MNTIICPISNEKVNESAVRINGFLVAVTVSIYLFSSNPILIAFLLIDFAIRAFSNPEFSPYARLSKFIVKALNRPILLIDKAPKLFAARVGFLFSITILLLSPFPLIASTVVASILLACALLESLLNFCVGCVVYTYLVLPFNRLRQ